MVRTTITIPSDLLREIKKIRRYNPELTQNSALLALARTGAANAILEDVGDLSALALRLESTIVSNTERQNSMDSTLKQIAHSSLQNAILLRRYISNVHGDEGGQILNQAKTDLKNYLEKQG